MPHEELEPMSDKLWEQLSLLENSQGLIRTIFLGIALQYKALDQQKCLLLENFRNPENKRQDTCPDPKSMQIAASLIVLSALFGFQTQEGVCPDWMEPKLNATVILVALLRLCRLAAPALDASAGRSLPETAETQEVRQAEELEELDLLAEPAI